VVGPVILVHGGAGCVADDSGEARREGCLRAARIGWRLLEAGGSAVDAVERAVVELEDNPLFNAGTGSTLNEHGTVETDAAIMDGWARNAGAVAALSGQRNPVKVARRVMDEGRHVLLAGAGADLFAEEQGFERIDPRELIVSEQQERYDRRHGTVGAVAMDSAGRLAAATSTGGVLGKRQGRVGDSPLVGCGTWADHQVAVSCTGDGEFIIRVTLARLAAFHLQRAADPAEAARLAIAELDREVGGEAGLIMVSASGLAGYARNSAHMPVCVIDGQGERTAI
jgi:beta-aspartyl-peptidase (threonine type)